MKHHVLCESRNTSAVITCLMTVISSVKLESKMVFIVLTPMKIEKIDRCCEIGAVLCWARRGVVRENTGQ
jgi:hypothetical protein